MSLSKEQMEFTQDIALLILEAKRLGIGLTFGEAYRTADQQTLYFYGKKLTVYGNSIQVADDKKRSWTLNSKHLSRLAIDFNFFVNGDLTYKKEDLQKLGDFWESLNKKNRWGGNFSKNVDTPHFERDI